MLVLTRRPGEQVIIGTEVEITICGVQSNRVKLGISAPQTVPVRRSELPAAPSRVDPGDQRAAQPLT